MYNCTSIFVLGGTACTLDQLGMCLAAQDGRRADNSNNKSSLHQRTVAVVFLKSPLVRGLQGRFSKLAEEGRDPLLRVFRGVEESGALSSNTISTAPRSARAPS